jgi:adenylate cyclase
MRIDEIRDAADEPGGMLGSLLDYVVRDFDAELGLLYSLRQPSQELELRAAQDRKGILQRLTADALHGLAHDSLRVDGVSALDDKDLTDRLGWPTDRACVALVPIVMGSSQRLGTMLLLRSREPFSEAEVDALTFVESQLDSALVQANRLFELDLRTRELETIYRVDKIRDDGLPFDDMLNRVLEELGRVIEADMSFIMLYDNRGDKLEMRAVSPTDLAQTLEGIRVAEETAREAVLRGELVEKPDREGRVGSVMCVPLILHDEILGVFGMASERQRGFRDPERRLLSAIASQTDTAIFEGLERRRLRQVLGRSVDPAVMERLLESSDVEFLSGERQVLTVLYGDMRGSTALAEATEPSFLVEFVNEYLGAMAQVILESGATLDKFVGDQVMALFGAPFPMEDHALRAVRVAVEMQRVYRKIVERWNARGLMARSMGIGIATGELTVGEFGSAQRSDYTVIGHAANLGAHLCGAARGEEILLSAATYELTRDAIRAAPLEGLHLKGIREDLKVYRLEWT